MVTMFAKHKVGDYGKWKRVYDEVQPIRKENGVTSASVYRDASDPSLVIITHQFKNLDAATAFAHSDALKSAMANAGVIGAPEFWFGENIERTSN
jgi:quinol monooxygenase YgiN